MGQNHLSRALGHGITWDHAIMQLQVHPCEMNKAGNATAQVQTWGQGSLAQALGLMVKAGESALLTAGTGRLGGTQVTN